MRYNRLYKDNNFLTPTTYTQTLSEYAANLKYEDIPPEVVERAKMILLQTIGVTLGAKGTPIYEKALRMAKEANGGVGGATTMWGTGEKLSAVNAALALGTASDALDWEDCSWTGHPAAGVIPCAWLAAEERHKSGKDLITAIVAGYEVYQRIAMAVQPSDERWKKKGIRNNRDALDEPRCYTGVICGNDGSNGSGETTIRSEEADLSWLTKELGQRYLIMRTLLKHWPANMWVQTPVEIISDLVQREGFGPEDVEEIIVDPPVRARMWAPDEGFTSVTHAQFSIPFVIASFLYDPHPGAHWYTPERMKDPKRIALAKRVKAGPSPEESPMSSFKQFREEQGFPMKTITVKLKDGRTFVEKMDCHPGHPDNMMSREQFADRFRVQAAPVLQGEALEKALETLCRIEEVEDISTLDGLLG